MNTMEILKEASCALWVGSVQAFAGWLTIGAPTQYAWIAVCCGVGLIISFSLWLFSRKHPRAQIVDEETPEDILRPPLPPGTRAERAADLLAYKDGRMLLEEYLARWSGRMVVRQTYDVGTLAHDLEIEDIANSAAPISKPPTTGLDYFLSGADPSRVPMKFTLGQWARVQNGSRRGGKLVKLLYTYTQARVPCWDFEYWDDINLRTMVDSLAEVCFEIAVPRDGEWWEFLRHDGSEGGRFGNNQHVALGQNKYRPGWGTNLQIESYLSCGCLVPVNFGRGNAT